MDKSIEEWRDIVGYEGKYQISNFGRVKSLERRNFAGNLIKQRIMKFGKTKDGYLQVPLAKLGKRSTKKVHRLVAEAFIGIDNQKETINHIDGNKENNTTKNLEWANREEQVVHAYKNKLKTWNKKSRQNACNAVVNPIKVTDKSNGVTKFFINTAVASRFYGKSRSWARKILEEFDGENKKYSLKLVNINEADGVFVKEEDLK